MLFLWAWRSPAQLAPPAAVPEAAPADPQLAAGLWEVRRALEAGDDWRAIRDRLAQALADAPEAPPRQQQTAASYLAGLDATLARLRGVGPVGPDASTAELVAALPESRIDPALIAYPAEYDRNETYVWDALLERRGRRTADPALLLYQRGRPVLAELIEAIGDPAATRSVSRMGQSTSEPMLLRAGDVALGLVEAIAHRRFRETGGGLPVLVSEWPGEKREHLVERLRTWQEATQELEATEATLWKLDEEPPLLQVQVLNGLLRSGAREAVRGYLETRYRNGNELRRDLPTLLLRAGSRAPLDFVAQQASSGLMLSQDKVELVAEFGADRDFQNLACYVRQVAGQPAANTPSHMKAVVDGLRRTPDRRALPAMVAVLDWEVSRLAGPAGSTPQIPLYVDDAAALVETWSGVQFGHRHGVAPGRRLRAMQEILSWWNAGGKSAYDLAYNPGYGPGGLR